VVCPRPRPRGKAKGTWPTDDERSGETAFDEAVRTKKVLRGGLGDSKWFVRGLDPVEKRRARGLPGTYEEEQKKVSEVKSWRFYVHLLTEGMKSFLFLSKDRKPIETQETATPQAAPTPPPAPDQSHKPRRKHRKPTTPHAPTPPVPDQPRKPQGRKGKGNDSRTSTNHGH
jgi:hypothetical protein